MPAPFGDYLLAEYSVSRDRAEIRMRARRRERGEPRTTLIEFTAGYARAGWPSSWTNSAAQVLAKLRAEGIRAYDVSSSVGMSGWVLATSFETLAADS